MAIPAAIKGYWGIVETAAQNRAGSGSLFSAINEYRALNTQSPITGIDAIQMGQIYSLAVQQRNAANAFQLAFNALQEATGAHAEALRNQSIASEWVTTTLASASAEIRAIAPTYSIRYEYSFVTPTGEISTTFGYIHTVTLESMSMGDVVTLIQQRITANITTPDLTSFPLGSTFAMTGKVNLLTL